MVGNASQAHDVAHPHIGLGHAVLLDESHAAGELLFRHPGDILAVEGDATCIRAAQARQNAQQRGFAAAVGPQQSDRFAARHPQRDIIDDDLLPAFQVIFSAQILITYSLSGR